VAIQTQSRSSVAAWGEAHTLAEINRSVYSLSDTERMALCQVVLWTTATPADRATLLDTVDRILSHPELGFYAEILSYTPIEIGGDGFYFTGDAVLLNRDAYFGEDDTSRRNFLMHEAFHSFNAHNGVVVAAMNEGSAVWVRKRPFLEEYNDGEDFAECVFGTVNFYRDIMDQPGIELSAPVQYTRKLLDVYTWLSAGDSSRLPWWDTELLEMMYLKYYTTPNRNVDFYTQWLPMMVEARKLMLADPLMDSALQSPIPTGT
jgi:hypothetical protein